jgi:uncharacterized membrane protein YeaQ/YmgE (transglycosylase-associated protein family)
MNPFIWCAVGAAVGWISGVFMPVNGLVNRAENMLVAVFGAFIGGEFLSTVLASGPPVTGFRVSSLALAIGASVGMLALLALMRRTVGPMRPHKVPKKPRF